MSNRSSATTHSPHYTYIDPDHLRNHLKLKTLQAQNRLKESHGHAVKFLEERGVSLSKIREHSGKMIAMGALASYLLMAPPAHAKLISSPAEIIEKLKHDVNPSNVTDDKTTFLVDAMKAVLPTRQRPLTRVEEKYLEQIFQSTTGVSTRATLEGEHLNTTYGLIGAEQHLMRYPGDAIVTHPKVEKGDEGMAPGRGAWGYFANSKEELTPDLIEKEKWYAVVQTLYLPDWNIRTRYLRDWYKYRKVMIVNTDNGKAVIADIADSGPAMFTGKSFGGSPEVMNYLGGSRYKKGPVVLFFVDDPYNKVKLGPVEYNKVANSSLLTAGF